jgi:hypothetical protein
MQLLVRRWKVLRIGRYKYVTRRRSIRSPLEGRPKVLNDPRLRDFGSATFEFDFEDLPTPLSLADEYRSRREAYTYLRRRSARTIVRINIRLAVPNQPEP